MSVIKVNKIEHTGTTAGGVEVDSSGHVQVGGLQMPTAGVLSNRNYVINGSFQVWQRGTSFTANSAVTFGADRFAAYGPSSSANAYTRSTDVPANQGFTYSGSFDDVDIRHAIELPGDALRGQFVNGSKWTLSFWVKGGSTGTSSVNVGWSDGTSSSQLTYWGTAASFTYSTSWEKKELTFTVANNLVSGDKAVLLYFSAFSGQKITGIQFEQGEKATPFEHRSYGDELASCLRYFHTANWQYCWLLNGVTYRAIAPGPAIPMRTTPDVSYFHPSTGTANQARQHSSGAAHTINDVGNPSDAYGPSAYFGMSSTPTYPVTVKTQYDAEL